MKTFLSRKATAVFALISLIISSNIGRSSADTLDLWKWRNPLPSAGLTTRIDYLNGQFVAYAFAPGLRVSSDGTNWTAISLPFDGSINRVTYGNGRYVVAGSGLTGGLLASSPDLSNWTISDSGTENALDAVAFGDGLFAAVGSKGFNAPDFTSYLITSPDGINWTRRDSPTNSELSDIAYGNGRFVAAMKTSAVIVSTDGLSWTPATAINGEAFTTISFADGKFYASGYSNFVNQAYPALAASSDGLNWTPALDPRTSGNNVFRAISGKGIPLGVSDASSSPPLSFSTDGSNFVAFSANNFSGRSVAFGNGLFVNNNLQASLDATNWTSSAISPTNSNYFIQDIFSTTNGYVAVTTPLLVSSNGLKFSFVTNTIPVANTRVKAANGLFVAVGISGNLARSTNGLDWESRTSGTGNSLNDIDYGNSAWVAVGNSGTITTSSTGNAWSLRTSGTSLSLNGIVYAINQFVIVGATGTVLTSPDGITWTAQFSGTVENFDKITYGNGQLLAVGNHGITATSPNGVDWTTHSSGVQAELSAVAFGDGTFCAAGTAGQTNVVLTSTNGIAWKQRHVPDQPVFDGSIVAVRFLNGTFFFVNETSILQSGPVIPPTLNVSFNGAVPQVGIQCSSNLLLKLESADNVNGPWADRGLFTNSLGAGITFPDASGTGQPQRFYQVVTP